MGSGSQFDPSISPSHKASDWKKVRDKLTVADADIWNKAFDDYFMSRLHHRYFRPIQILQAESAMKGEGFSIVAIQCTLIEFLESTVQGVNYQYKKPSAFEYKNSGKLFVSFLSRRSPFDKEFDEGLAGDFYANVRCPLLHEARTKGGWTIWAGVAGGKLVDANKKRVFRNAFQRALLAFVDGYRKDLVADPELQKAFMRKFEVICT